MADETNDEIEYRKQLGLVGLQMMNLAEKGSSALRNPRREQRSLSRPDDSVFEANITEIDDSSFDSLVDRMRTSTFKVRVVGAFTDIVEPLYERMRLLNEEDEMHNSQRHHESSLYMDKLLTAIQSMESSNDGQNRGIYLAYKEFMRHPVWNSLKFTMNALYESSKLTYGVLFGFKKQQSDTDRIVEAIERQTEWHMTKSIGQQKGFFSRLMSQGILGMPIRGLANIALNGLNMGRNRAQDQENARARGDEVPSGFKTFFSDFFFKDVIDQQGRLGTDTPTTLIAFDPTFNSDYFDTMSDILDASYKKHNTVRAVNELYDLVYDINRGDHAMSRDERHSISKRHAETINMMKDERTGVFQIARYTKGTEKEVRKHRLQALWSSIISIGTSLVTGIVGFGGRILGALLPLGGIIGRLGATIITGLGAKILSLANILSGGADIDTGGKKKPKGGKPSRIGGGLIKGIGAGAILGIGGDVVADYLGRETVGGAAAGVVSDTASYAATGALIGSVVPGVGTAIGGLVGGGIGLGKGLWDNREALFGGGDTTVDSITADVADTARGAWQGATQMTNEVWDNATSFGEDVMNDALDVGRGAISATMNLGRDTIEKSSALFDSALSRLTDILPSVDNTSLPDNLTTQLAEEMSKKSDETLKAINDGTKQTEEMVKLLKGILTNTKQKAADNISPLADTGADLWQLLGGKK